MIDLLIQQFIISFTNGFGPNASAVFDDAHSSMLNPTRFCPFPTALSGSEKSFRGAVAGKSKARGPNFPHTDDYIELRLRHSEWPKIHLNLPKFESNIHLSLPKFVEISDNHALIIHHEFPIQFQTTSYRRNCVCSLSSRYFQKFK